MASQWISRLGNLFSRYRGEVSYSASAALTPALGFVASAIAAMFVVPAEMGIIQSAMLIVPYAQFLQFGVFNGLNRNYAFYRAQGDDEAAQRSVNTSFMVARWVSVVGVFAGVLVLSILMLRGLHLTGLHAAAYGSAVAALFFSPRTTHYDTTYRSGQEFGRLGRIVLSENCVYGLGSLLPAAMGAFGKTTADTLRVIVSWFLRMRAPPCRATGPGDWGTAKELVRVGFPLLVGGYLWGVFTVADTSFIALHMSPEAVGHYTLARLVMTGMVAVPAVLNTMLYPKASARYARAGDASALRRFYWRALLLNAVAVLGLSVLAGIFIGPVVHRFMPRYAPGLPAAYVNILAGMAMIASGPGVLVGVLRRNTPQLIALAVVVVLFWMLSPGLHLNADDALVSVAWLRCTLGWGFALFTLAYTYWLVRPLPAGTR